MTKSCHASLSLEVLLLSYKCYIAWYKWCVIKYKFYILISYCYIFEKVYFRLSCDLRMWPPCLPLVLQNKVVEWEYRGLGLVLKNQVMCKWCLKTNKQQHKSNPTWIPTGINILGGFPGLLHYNIFVLLMNPAALALLYILESCFPCMFLLRYCNHILHGGSWDHRSGFPLCLGYN